MELQEPTMQSLFAQLGEADDEASIARFIEKNASDITYTKLHEAPFWSPAQAAFLREAIHQDANWAAVVDVLSVQLHQARKSGPPLDPLADELDPRFDPTAETAYWRSNFAARPYVDRGGKFDDYGPAYDYGVDAAFHYEGRAFEDVESDLEGMWDKMRGKSTLAWDRARHAARDAWDRIRSML